MQEQAQQEAESFLAIALLDNSGRVVAINREWGRLTPGGESPGPASRLMDIAAGVPGLAEWVANAGEVKREFNGAGQPLIAEVLPLSTLANEAEPLLLVTVRPAIGAAGEDTAMRLRHDIKNRIGGLKLYATFLKRKLGDQQELLDVVNKMIESLDQMNLEANKIRF